jgi:hypothetical protein
VSFAVENVSKKALLTRREKRRDGKTEAGLSARPTSANTGQIWGTQVGVLTNIASLFLL